MRYTHYLALGDSMSTDEYPTCDLMGLASVPSQLLPAGAAALLHRNRDDLWPQFAGKDLASECPGIEVRMLAWDGAMIEDVMTDELARVGHDSVDPSLLVTLTAGGNDLLDALMVERSMPAVVEEILERYAELVEWLRDEFPNATLLLTTVYDPTDGTGLLPGLSEHYGTLPIEHLHRFNDHVRRVVQSHPGSRLADVHQQFLGHGMSAPAPERWYWSGSLIEPNARGASEIRAAWWEALENAEGHSLT
jgi:lysophospholipase L1-like esterase